MTSTVIYYMGVTDSNGFLDKSKGYMYSSSSTTSSLTCAGDASNLLSDGTASIDYGTPAIYSTYADWYSNNYDNLKCFYVISDLSIMTGIDVDATVAGTYYYTVSFTHTDTTVHTLG
jgi:hypothetical protein